MRRHLGNVPVGPAFSMRALGHMSATSLWLISVRSPLPEAAAPLGFILFDRLAGLVVALGEEVIRHG
jgi:hypothetical protein